MVSRRSQRRRKKDKALGDFISVYVRQLRFLAGNLNGEGRLPGDDRELMARAAAVVDAVLDESRGEGGANLWRPIGSARGEKAAYPVIPNDAAIRFNELADETPLYYMADATGAVRRKDANYLVIGVTADAEDGEMLPWMHLRTPAAQGVWVAWLAGFLINPRRDRLRRCQTCRRWFVDETRNLSARRCSRVCTIKWSNSQRATRVKKGARR